MLSKIRHYIDVKCLKSIYDGILGTELIFNQKTSHFAKKLLTLMIFLNGNSHTVPFNKI